MEILPVRHIIEYYQKLTTFIHETTFSEILPLRSTKFSYIVR